MPKSKRKNNKKSFVCLFRDAIITAIEEAPEAYTSYPQIVQRSNDADIKYSNFIKNTAKTSEQYDEIMSQYYAATNIHNEVFIEVGMRTALSFMKDVEN